MSNSITLPASMQPPAPPPGALDNPSNPTEPIVHYQLSDGKIASLPQSSAGALMQQDAGAKQIPSPESGQVLVQLSSGHAATVPAASIHSLKQQDPGFKYIAGDTTSPDTASHQDLLGAVQGATMGSTTALATPLPPELSQEGSGVLDILRGNIRQGAGKVFAAETPHVIQGSLLEKAIQKINPSFQGSVTNDQVAQHAASFDAGSRPLVDVASSIDKSTSPAAKALAETAQSFTTPNTIATLYATGGLGLVKSPAALGMASKLISLGFSAASIADAYKYLTGFKDAYDSGDRSEAIYQITHAITSGTLGIFAARDAVSKLPPIPNPFRKVTVAGEEFSPNPVIRTGPNEAAGTTAIQNIAGDATTSAGGTPTANPMSLRDVWNEPIAAQTAKAKVFYKLLDDASDNQWTANQNALENVRRDIRMKGGIDEDIDAKLNARKIQLEWQQDQILDKLPAGTKDAARSNWVVKSRLEDLQDIFNKKSNVSGARPEMTTPGVTLPAETYNFKGIAKDLNAMDPAELTTALGSKQAAQNLTTGVNLAARQGWASGKTLGLIKSGLALTGLGHIGGLL